MPTIKTYALDLIDDNPWNERELDQENVDAIAASIRVDGLLQYPVGRVHPTQPDRVQLAYGHHRLAAYRQLDRNRTKINAGERAPYAEIPIDVRVITDQAMAVQAVAENHSRLEPSAIEKARALLRLTTEFKMTQAEAGAKFGLQQPAVAQLKRLLDLPAPIQDLVNARRLPERNARALITFSKWRPDLAVKVAETAAGTDPDKRDEMIGDTVAGHYRNHAQSLSDWARPWPLEWPQKPIEAAPVGQVPDCNGCPFHAKVRGDHYCLRKECFDIKQRLWRQHALELASKRLGIQPAAKGEKVTILWEGGYDHVRQQKMQKLVRARHVDLRLAIQDHNDHSQTLEAVTGSPLIVLVTVNKARVEKWLEEKKGKPVKAEPIKGESTEQKVRRINGNKELEEERWHERSTFNRARADVLWMLGEAARLVADQTSGAGGLLMWAATRAESSYNPVWCNEVTAARRVLREMAGASGGHRPGESYLEPSTPEQDRTRRGYIAYSVIAEHAAGNKPPSTLYSTFPKVRDEAERIALKTFGVQLPAGWATPPIHHTAYNCWECGAFAGHEGSLTKDEIKKGWKAVHDSAGKLLGVVCPVHGRNSAEHLIAKFTPAPAKGQVKPAKAPAPARGHVRGHETLAQMAKSTGRYKRKFAQQALAAKAAKKRPAAKKSSTTRTPARAAATKGKRKR